MHPEPLDISASTAPWTDFPPLSPDRWRERIRADLKGADFDKLVWHTLDGLAIQPFYTAADASRRDAIPTSRPGNDWLIRQDISASTVEEARQHIQDAVKGGANSLGLHVDPKLTVQDVRELLADLPLGNLALHLSSQDAPLTLLDALSQVIQDLGYNLPELTGSLICDPLSPNEQHGEGALTQALDELSTVTSKVTASGASLYTISVDARPYHNAGASIAQELGCTLAAASEYLVQMTERSHTVADIVARMRFEVAVGTSFFPEIAKLRALRLLFAQIIRTFDATLTPPTVFVRADTSRWSLTLYDPHVNLLRTTTEATAAILGGCDALSILPYDVAMSQPSAHARRLALNIQHILKHEAHLDVVADPAAGSYYLEHLTDELAAAGWSFFQKIEARGGLLAALRDGFVQQEIGKSRDQRFARIDAGKTVFVGTNTFPQAGESRLDEVPADPSVPDEVFPTIRGTAHFEALRLRTERRALQTGHTPRVLPLMLGDPVMANARATFARNFFGVAGFQILSEQRHETPEQAAHAALAAEADLVVLCSADGAYPEIAAPFCDQLNLSSDQPPLVVVAGYPDNEVDSLKRAGVDAFIHRKTPLLVALTDFQERLNLHK